jgi:hypothetical protein
MGRPYSIGGLNMPVNGLQNNHTQIKSRSQLRCISLQEKGRGLLKFFCKLFHLFYCDGIFKGNFLMGKQSGLKFFENGNRQL